MSTHLCYSDDDVDPPLNRQLISNPLFIDFKLANWGENQFSPCFIIWNKTLENPVEANYK